MEILEMIASLIGGAFLVCFMIAIVLDIWDQLTTDPKRKK
jgi:hypothetical protein|tara:strand:- start:91 stop:210 length:120 start_codon:yes stop_codon:yes gene_type:complete